MNNETKKPSSASRFYSEFCEVTGYGGAVENGVKRLKDGRLTTEEVHDILMLVRNLLESPPSTARRDSLEDDSIIDLARAVFTEREVRRNSGRLN